MAHSETSAPAWLLRSPHDVDPLSWFTRPFLPLTFAFTMAGFGVLFVAATWNEFGSPALQLLAVACLVVGCLAIHRRPRSRLTSFRTRHAILPLALAWSGLGISGAVSHTSGDVSLWWAPLGVALVLAALAPFSSSLQLVVYGTLSTVVCAVVTLLSFDAAPDGNWPLATTIVMGALVPAQATVATALFSGFIVDRVLRWSRLPIKGSLVSGPSLDFSRWNSEQDDLRLLSDRVIPFIEQIAEDGFITVRDREVAADLAREVRDALIQGLDSSWLEVLASDHGLRVVDPEHRAERLTMEQRGAVRSLILAVLRSPALVPETMAIELRDSADGGVAVGLSMRIDLPEGKRLRLLAPYYVSLASAVDDLEWDDDEELRMRFRIPAPKPEAD